MTIEPVPCSCCGYYHWDHINRSHYEPGMGLGTLTLCPIDPDTERDWLERQYAADRSEK